MKIIFWNIKKVGNSKLNNVLSPGVIGAGGLGTTTGAYITKVVMGDPIWSKATSATAADVFVVIELVSGGHTKGDNAFGTCLTALPRLVSWMNAAAQGVGSAKPTYTSTVPKITGRAETVGIIYNTNALTYVSDGVMRNQDGNFLSKRSPLWAQFTMKDTGDLLNIIGIHGPTSQPTSSQYTAAVSYTNKIATIAQVMQTSITPTPQATLIGGDFNCDGANSYAGVNGSKKTKINAFADLTSEYSYSVLLPQNTKTSLLSKHKAAAGDTPAAYLSQPYDNIVSRLPKQTGANVKVIDLCSKAPTWETNPVATFNAARRVSDHLPISISW